MADILLDHHDHDGKNLSLSGHVVGDWGGKRVRATLLPPGATGETKPIAEKTITVGSDGTFKIDLPIKQASFGTRLIIIDPDDEQTFWIGSGAKVPLKWFIDIPGLPPVGPGDTTPSQPGTGPGPGGGGGGSGSGKKSWFTIPCLCALLPFSCTTLLGSWKALLLISVGFWNACLVLFPPDWHIRTAWCILHDEGLNAERLARVTSTSAAGGGTGAAATSGLVGGVGGAGAGTAMAPGPGTAAGAAGGAGLGAGAGGTGGSSGAAAAVAAGEITDQQTLRTVRGYIGLVDGGVAMLGHFTRILAELITIAALVLMVIWWICCARGSHCRLISNLAWVLEALIIVVMPVGGAIVGFLIWAFAFVPHVSCTRAGTQWFLELFGGVLISTLIYGIVRWLRDRGRCPVLVLWQWPWTEVAV